MSRLRNLRIYSSFITLRGFFRKVEINPLHFAVPASLSLLASVFEGLSIGILVPFVKGAIQMDFSFVREWPFFQEVFIYLPQSIGARNITLAGILLSAIFASAVLKNLFMYLSNCSVFYEIQKFAHNLRTLLFSRYLSFGKLYFDRANVGHIAEILSGHVNSVADALSGLNNFFYGFFMFAVYVALMIFISWKLTLIVFLTFPLFGFSVKWLMKRIQKTSEIQTRLRVGLSAKMFNILSCMPLVKSYSQEMEEGKIFASLSNSLRQIDFSMNKKTNLIFPIQEIVTLTTFLALISFMILLISKQRVGTVAGYLVYFYLIRRTLNMLSLFNDVKSRLSAVVGPVKDILSILSDEGKYFVSEGKKRFNRLNEGIEFKNLDFSYLKEVPVLRSLNFLVKKGETTAVVGPSGGGKTTLIHLAMRFYDSPPGSVLVDGIDIRDFTLKSLHDRMAFVSQEALLFNDTLRSNLTFGLNGKVNENDLWDAVKKARLDDFVNKLPEKLDTLIGDRGIRLSGGEKQRVSIARAILKKADILILDEATSALDTRTEKLIQEAIDEAIQGKTAIIIAHRLSTIQSADKIVVIEEGELIEEGSLQELLSKKGKFYAYWEAQKFY